MALPDAGVSTRVVRPVLAGLLMHGVDPAPLLADVGLRADELADPDARVPHGAVVRLWELAASATSPTLGFAVVQAMDFGQFDVQSYAFAAAPNLGVGLRTLIRYHRLNHDAAELALHVRGDEACFRHALPGGHQLPPAAAQFVLGSAARAARVAASVLPREVRFRHPLPPGCDPDDPAGYGSLGCPVRFGAEHREVVFAAGDLELPHAQADPTLGAILRRHGDGLLAALPRVHSFVDRARALLLAELDGGDPSAEALAARLRLSPRTLARRLKAEGTTHRELLDGLRKELAERYLADGTLSLGEVGFLLGFSEPSAFHRAFRRWTGQTPGAWRARRGH